MLVAAANSSASYYQLLQIPPQATAQELRRAFRSLSKRYHPDTTELPEQEAREAFRRLQQAYLTLSDPERRRAYDAALVAIQTPPAPRRVVAVPGPGSGGGGGGAGPLPVRRALSGGEWFALLLLAVAVVFSLVLGVGLAWARGAELVRAPSWWPATAAGTLLSPAPGMVATTPPASEQIAGQTAAQRTSPVADDGSAALAGAALQPSPAGPRELAAGPGGPAAGRELLPVGPAAAGLER